MIEKDDKFLGRLDFYNAFSADFYIFRIWRDLFEASFTDAAKIKL